MQSLKAYKREPQTFYLLKFSLNQSSDIKARLIISILHGINHNVLCLSH